MKQFAKLSLCVLVALMAFTVGAEEKKAKKTKKAKPQIEELTLVGKISKNEAPEAEEGKKAKKVAPYTLTLEDGTEVNLQKGSLKKAKIDLDAFDGKTVTLTGKGIKKTVKEKIVYQIRVVTAVEEVAAEAAE